MFLLVPRKGFWQKARYRLDEENWGVLLLLIIALPILFRRLALVAALAHIVDPLVRSSRADAACCIAATSSVTTRAAAGASRCTLGVFEGPFDLLLGLIAKHELDITAISLSTVTDEFIAFIRQMGPVWDLDQASEFLVIAATLVDLKAARLLPSGEVEDEEDLALLEARDLLFARLLQYRAYKEVAAIMAAMFAAETSRFPRAVGPGAPVRRFVTRGIAGARSEAVRRTGGPCPRPRGRPQSSRSPICTRRR